MEIFHPVAILHEQVDALKMTPFTERRIAFLLNRAVPKDVSPEKQRRMVRQELETLLAMVDHAVRYVLQRQHERTVHFHTQPTLTPVPLADAQRAFAYRLQHILDYAREDGAVKEKEEESLVGAVV